MRAFAPNEFSATIYETPSATAEVAATIRDTRPRIQAAVRKSGLDKAALGAKRAD